VKGQWDDDFSWVDDEPLPELASGADLGVIVDYDDGAEPVVDVNRFGLMMAGVWVERLEEDGGCWQAQRLSWVSPVDGRHFFMDLRGITVAVCSSGEVAGLIDTGLLRIIEPLWLQVSG